MKNLIQAIELQKEKLDAIKFLLRRIETDNNNQCTAEMLRDLKVSLDNLILTDF
jgi:hypothetical protein